MHKGKDVWDKFTIELKKGGQHIVTAEREALVLQSQSLSRVRQPQHFADMSERFAIGVRYVDKIIVEEPLPTGILMTSRSVEPSEESPRSFGRSPGQDIWKTYNKRDCGVDIPEDPDDIDACVEEPSPVKRLREETDSDIDVEAELQYQRTMAEAGIDDECD